MEEIEPVELIAILNPRAVDNSRLVLKLSHRNDLTIDVLARLARCSVQASTLARVKYADMQTMRTSLSDMIAERFYKRAKMLPLYQMSEMVIMEVCDARACRWCRGVTWFPEMDETGRPTGKRITCDGCCGEGIHKWHDSERMHRLQVSEKDWKNNMMQLYSDMLDTVWGWDRQIRDAMA